MVDDVKEKEWEEKKRIGNYRFVGAQRLRLPFQMGGAESSRKDEEKGEKEYRNRSERQLLQRKGGEIEDSSWKRKPASKWVVTLWAEKNPNGVQGKKCIDREGLVMTSRTSERRGNT